MLTAKVWILAILCYAAMCSFVVTAWCASPAPDPTALLNAIAQVESGNRPLLPHWDVNANRLGYFQISAAYWSDAAEKDKTLDAKHGGSWERCQNDRAYAARVVLAYFSRYCPKALASGDWETCAKVHNGGGGGPTNSRTIGYWKKVKAVMESAR